MDSDSETGESLRDKETGETPAAAKVNLETGESEINRTMPEKPNTRKFRIPSTNPQPKPKSQLSIKKNDTKTSNNHSFRNSSDVTPCILFLLPTALCFYPAIAAFITIIEVILHVWAHKKNKTLSNKDVYYQSPLHIFVSEFCGACKEKRSASKITNLQDKRNYKFIKYGIDYVHGIVM